MLVHLPSCCWSFQPLISLSPNFEMNSVLEFLRASQMVKLCHAESLYVLYLVALCSVCCLWLLALVSPYDPCSCCWVQRSPHASCCALIQKIEPVLIFFWQTKVRQQTDKCNWYSVTLLFYHSCGNFWLKTRYSVRGPKAKSFRA